MYLIYYYLHCYFVFRWSIAWAPHNKELEKVMEDAFSFTPNLKRKLSVYFDS